jgi:hypothetical protein
LKESQSWNCQCGDCPDADLQPKVALAAFGTSRSIEQGQTSNGFGISHEPKDKKENLRVRRNRFGLNQPAVSP